MTWISFQTITHELDDFVNDTDIVFMERSVDGKFHPVSLAR